MQRRNFLKIAGAASVATAASREAIGEPVSFAGKLCINESTSMNHDFDVCMAAYAKAGIRNVEPWIHKIRQFVGEESMAVARRVLSDNGLHAPCSCCMGELIEPHEKHAEKVEQLKRNLELVKEVGIERFVVHSFTQKQFQPDDYKVGVEHVRELGEIGESFGVIVNIEFIRVQRFLGTLPTSLRLVREAQHPNVRPLLDLYHFWVGQGKMQDLEMIRDGEIDHVHFHDTPDLPREILKDQDRVFPGEGVAPIGDMLAVLKRKKYKGYFSIELFGKTYQDADPYEIAKRAIKTSVPFLT